MPRFAVIKNGTVQNTIVADTKNVADEATGADCVEVSEQVIYQIGWLYDQASDTFSPPVAKPEDGKEYVWNFELKTWNERFVG